jgi:hypothetical protein
MDEIRPSIMGVHRASGMVHLYSNKGLNITRRRCGDYEKHYRSRRMGWLILIDAQAAEKAVFWLGETKGFWVQTGALFLSAVGALWIVFSRDKREKARATVDVVLHQKADSGLEEAKRKLLKLHENGHKNFAAFLADKECEEYKAIFKVLNGREFIAAGIRQGAYDEKLFKRMQCASLIRDWNALSGFVMEFRNSIKGKVHDTETFYQDFEWLAARWIRKPLKPSKR